MKIEHLISLLLTYACGLAGCVKTMPQDPVGKRRESAKTISVTATDDEFTARSKARVEEVRLFLPKSLIVPKTQRSILPDDLAFEVNEIDLLEPNPVDASDSAEDPDCAASLAAPLSDPKDPTLRSIKIGGDFTKCLDKTTFGEDAVETASFEWSVVVGCDAWQTASDAEPTDSNGLGFLCGGHRYSMFYQSKILYKIVTKDTSATTESVSSYSTVDGGPCVAVRNGDIWNFDDCEVHQIDRTEGNILPSSSEIDPVDLPLDHSVSLIFHHILLKDTDRFYRQGSIDLVIGDWQGEVRYADGGTPPRWQLKNGSFERAGFYQPQGSELELRPSPRRRFRNLVHFLKRF